MHSSADKEQRAQHEGELPTEVFYELVAAIYAPLGSFLIGAGLGVVVSGFIAWRTMNIPLATLSLLLCGVVSARLALTHAWRRRGEARIDDVHVIRFWERAFAVGAFGHTALLGAICFVTLYQTDDVISHLLADAFTTGYTAGATGRNASRPRIAIGQLALTLVPIALAAALRGGYAYGVLFLMTVLYFLAAVEITKHIYRKTVGLLLTTRDKTRLAQRLSLQNQRFDTTLNNMPHGVCMFDADERLVIANERVCSLLGLAHNALATGMTIPEIESLCFAKRIFEAGASLNCARAERVDPSDQGLGVKLRLMNGRVLARSCMRTPDGGSLVILEDITERQYAEARIQYLATHDNLTGLPNRVCFSDEIRAAIEAGRRASPSFYVLFVDLDRFKFINDSLGHAAGDILLREITTRIRDCLHAEDFVARLGGDEFVILLRHVDSAEHATRIVENLIARIEKPLLLRDQECQVGASIGVSVFPRDGEDEETLIRKADAAMYLAKEEGRNRFRFFSTSVKTQSVDRLALETSLRHALDLGALSLDYQPKRALADGRMSGVEALIRWNTKDIGTLSPEQFLSLAEDAGLIVSIGKWALKTACLQYKQWCEQALPPIRIAVNLSARQFADAGLIEDVKAALLEANMPPHLLELEITENAVMHNFENAAVLVHALRNIGVRIAIDDFGMGYSSLALIKKIPFDTLKIDKSFIHGNLGDIADKAIVEAIITLGKRLGMSVVAEGVETAQQEMFLRDRACDEIQGYLFSQPMPPEKLAEFIANYDEASNAH